MTNTTIVNEGDKIIVARFMFRKYHKIEFNIDVLAKDLIPYFSLHDEDFIKLTVRVLWYNIITKQLYIIIVWWCYYNDNTY